MRRLLFFLPVFLALGTDAQIVTKPGDAALKVTAAELHAALQRGDAVVIDVRGSVPYDLERIDGAISMPLGLVAARAEELPKDKLIVAYCTCKAEELSGEAVVALGKAGFQRTAALKGGLAAWREAGFKTAGRGSEGFEVPFSSAAAVPAADAAPAASRGGRLAPPVGLACDRNDLTSFAGVVSSYQRRNNRTRLIMKTDDGTTETFTLPTAKQAALQKRFLMVGGGFTAPDWRRIEARAGVLVPGTRAIVWVCSAAKRSVTVDWRPVEGQ